MTFFKNHNTNYTNMTEKKIIVDSVEESDEKDNRKTSWYMTKYEYTRLLATRTLQISAGAPPQINAKGIYDPMKIAQMEIYEHVIPLDIKRVLPDGSIEMWNVKDMFIRDF